MKKLIIFALAVPITLFIQSYQAQAKTSVSKPLHSTSVAKAVVIAKAPKKAPGNDAVKPGVVSAPEHRLSSSAPGTAPESTQYGTLPALGSASRADITHTVNFLLSKGLTKTATAYLTGNFIQESGLHPDRVGDNGLSLGLAQWHSTRRTNGLPGTLDGQLQYALDEINAQYPLMAKALHSDNEYDQVIGIRQFEGYGIEGLRYTYAKRLLARM